MKKIYLTIIYIWLLFPVNASNISVIAWQTYDNNYSYFKSIDIKADGWHHISTDVYKYIYLDGQPIVNNTNQLNPNHIKNVYIYNGKEYTDVDNKTFLTSEWIKFDGNWTTIDFYINDINTSNYKIGNADNITNLTFDGVDNFTFINSVWNISNKTNFTYSQIVNTKNVPCIEPNKWYNITEIYNITTNFTKCQSIQETPRLFKITYDEEYNGSIDEPIFYSKPLTLLKGMEDIMKEIVNSIEKQSGCQTKED